MTKSGSGAPSLRQLRVGEELRHALADIFRRETFRDPILAATNLTVTEARVSPDLRNATVFVLPLGGDHGEWSVLAKALERATPFLRSKLAHAVKMRTLPQLQFLEDHSFDEASRIDALLHSPKVAQDLEPSASEGDETEEEGEGDAVTALDAASPDGTPHRDPDSEP